MRRYTDYTFGTPNSQQGNGNSRNFNDGDYGGGSMSGDDFINDGVDNSGGGGKTGGGGLSSGGGGNTGDGGTKTTITENDILLNITCNINGAGVKFNGSFIGSVPKQLRISKVDLLEKGDRIIEIGKDGYNSKEKYVVSLNTNDSNIQKSSIFNGGYGGISQTEIVVKYYVNDREYQFPKRLTGKAQELTFTLKSNGNGDGNTFTKKKLTINLSGVRGGNPIVLKKNPGYRQSDIFPQLGQTTYEDKSNTKYTITSADLTLYRITNITYDDGYQMFPLDAKDNESLTMTFKLKTNYKISILVEAIPTVEPLIKPVIELLNNASRLYNINTEIGVPLAFKKNSSVEAITIIVGDDILEFDDLEAGDVAGVTIPHSTFEKIGKYNIKIFPFSLNDYDTEPEPIKPIREIPIKPIFKDIKEEIIQPTKEIIIKESLNQYIKTNTNTNYLSNNIGSNGYNFQFTGLSNFLNIDFNSSILNNYR